MELQRQTANNINTRSKKKKCIILIYVAILFAALAVWAFYIGLTVRTYGVTSDKMPQGSAVRIAVIADLHSHVYGKDQTPLLDIIKAQKPDIIALAGDIVDDHEPQTGAKLFLQDITDIAPTYYVSGNHEYWSGRCDEIKEMISGYGVKVLSNERQYISVNGARLCICGIDDPEVFRYTDDNELLALSDYEDLLKRFSDLDADTVNILLAHRPESIDAYRQYYFDVVLSGHTHGGQVRIPLLVNGVFAPNQGWFPKYAGGHYELEGMNMIVSRGLGFDARQPRVFNPPEVVVVDIKGDTSH